MDNALSPREIQSRIRAGQSLAEVAEAAGMPEDKVAAFAGPVLAEREHMVGVAHAALVRRRGDAQTHRSLGQVITERMHARRLDPDMLEWDSFRLPDRTWRIVGVLRQGDLVREAWLAYDPRGRFSVATNADARWLIGDEGPAGATDPDDENTVDLNDELALVRATTEESEPLPEPTPLRRKIQQAGEAELDELAEDYHPAELAEVDGMYDIVGPRQSQMDVLYEMLSGISEDSVRIYAGLTEPVVDPVEASDESQADVTPPIAAEDAPEPAPTPEADEVPKQDAAAEQDALIEATPDKPKRKRRASVPAWDDILFGSPPKKP